jgi:hypothetical protein
MGIVVLLSSDHIMHLLRQDRQQHPGTAGPDVMYYLQRGHVGLREAGPTC